MSVNPSLALIPCAYDTGKLYSVLPQDGSGDFTVSRNGNASYFDKDGILRTALPNEPRFDFDPLTGEFKGVLVEPNATNVLLNSETPATQTLLMTVAQRTISFYGSGTVTLSGAFSATITGNANPLIRTTFTFTPTATNLTITPSGNVTRWQLELGSVATSYIPTQGSQVTRPVDVISRTNAQDLIGQTEGSIYMEVSIINGKGAGLRLINIGTDNSNRIDINKALPNNNIHFRIGVNNVFTMLSVVTPNPLDGRVSKMLFRYGSNTQTIFIDGIQLNSITYPELPFLRDVLIGAQFVGGANLNDHIKSVVLFKTALSDEEAISITSL